MGKVEVTAVEKKQENCVSWGHRASGKKKALFIEYAPKYNFSKSKGSLAWEYVAHIPVGLHAKDLGHVIINHY